MRDTVRECLEKDPSERTEDDIETLLEFTQHLKAFTNMTLSVRRALCSVMVGIIVNMSFNTENFPPSICYFSCLIIYSNFLYCINWMEFSAYIKHGFTLRLHFICRCLLLWRKPVPL